MGYKIKTASASRKAAKHEHGSFEDTILDIWTSYGRGIAENKIVVAVVIILLVAVVTFFVGGNDQESASKMEYAARKSYVRDNPEEMKKALGIYEELIREHPGNAGLYLIQVGNIYSDLEQYDKAIEVFQKYIKKYDNKAILSVVYLKTGFLYLNSAKKDKAREFFNKIINMESAHNRNMAYMELGRLSEAEGKIDEAIGFYDMIVKESSSTLVASTALTRLDVLRKKGKKQEEEQLKKDALKATESTTGTAAQQVETVETLKE